MSLAKGIYRIRMWGAHEHPQYLSIIEGMVSIAGPDVPNVKDQEVTRRFLTSLYLVSYQFFSGSSRS